ncbi:protein regulator of cytokinesis 1-like [Linepithema humile]|uniref:protein regulator of cytokinesis 1-like n=1 Tax=Linepithema humile TaxID=83485 RepID=UPI0006238B0B|nr:PREDICTED: protein regulator of cytokinesis 1-like [Linepithema humile]
MMTDQPEWKSMEKTINENCKETFNKLEKILQNTECPKETRLMYYEQKVQNCIREQLDDIVAEAQSNKLLLKTIEDLKKQGHPKWKPVEKLINKAVKETLNELQKDWEDIGCPNETQLEYYEQVQNHIKDLLHDMIAETRSKKEQLCNNIKELLKQTIVIYTQLNLDMVPKTYDQIPLNEVEQMLQADLQNLERIKEERMMLLKELVTKQHNISEKLGTKKFNFTIDVLPSEQELENFKLYLQKEENEKIHLENVFTEIHHSIIKMMNDLDIAPSSSFEQLICNNPDQFVLNTNNMTKLREFRDKLKTQVEETKCEIEKMKEELLTLWKYLDEPADIYQSFLDRYIGYGTSTINAFNAEIKRLKEKRKENVFRYVTQIRYELMNWWDLCKYCEAQRNAFAPFHSNTFTEDLLTLHELEVEKLRKFYNDNRTIFHLLEQRENFVIKIKELLQRANNPDRYHNRGGQLLMEERERKMIQKKLPKIEAELKQLINEYETTHNQIFTIYGTSLENVLAESWENINHEKETIKKARKEAKDKSVKKSPLNSSKPGMSHLSVVKTPLGLSKRKLFTPSPNTSSKRNKNGDKTKPTVTASKIRRSGRVTKILVTKPSRCSKGGQKRKELSPNNSVVDTTYNQFQGHMADKEELHSSVLPNQILKTSNKLNIKKIPIVRTPMKPLRKNLSAATTPVSNSARKSPHSPRILRTPKLATATNNLPFYF